MSILVGFFRYEPRPYDEWRLDAKCAALGIDPEAFFQIMVDNYTKSICERCPVKLECGLHAIALEEKGFWGGLSEASRKQVPVEVKEYLRSKVA